MLQNKQLIRLLLSGLMTIALWQLYLRAKEENLELGHGLVDVVAAARDIPEKKIITEDDLTVKSVAQRFVSPGAFIEKLPGLNTQRLVGQECLIEIPASAQITRHMVRAPVKQTPGIATQISTQSGFPLRLGNLDIAKLILPGDRIDVLATFTVRHPGAQEDSRATYTILQNVRVLSVGKTIAREGREGRKEEETGQELMLDLTKDESLVLQHAQSESRSEITIVARAYGDDRKWKLPAIETSQLGVQPAMTAPKVRP